MMMLMMLMMITMTITEGNPCNRVVFDFFFRAYYLLLEKKY